MKTVKKYTYKLFKILAIVTVVASVIIAIYDFLINPVQFVYSILSSVGKVILLVTGLVFVAWLGNWKDKISDSE